MRVGLTGGLGSGKSTVAGYFREFGAEVLQADELGRELMEPGQHVFNEIARVFGPSVIGSDGRLCRSTLAEMAFVGGRLNELNAIVHPAVIAAQRVWMDRVFAAHPDAIAMVESALIFEVERDARQRGESEGVLADWRCRFDKIIVVTAPDVVKVERYVSRVSPGSWNEQAATDARSRLARQFSDEEKAARADFVLANTGDLSALRQAVAGVWEQLTAVAEPARYAQ